jgi:hypothetical protein
MNDDQKAHVTFLRRSLAGYETQEQITRQVGFIAVDCYEELCKIGNLLKEIHEAAVFRNRNGVLMFGITGEVSIDD